MDRYSDEAIEALYRSDWGRIVAALIRLVGDFEVAEEAAQEAFTAGVNQWRESGIPEFPRAWIIRTAQNKAIDAIRRKGRFAEKINLYARDRAERGGAGLRLDGDPRRPSSPDLHLLPPGPGARGAGGPHAAHPGRTGNRRDRAGVSGAGTHHGAAAGAREAQDSRCPHSVRSPGRRRIAGTPGRGADGDLPGLQRRVRGDPRSRWCEPICAARPSAWDAWCES